MEETAGDVMGADIQEELGPMDVQVLLSWFFEHAEPEEIGMTIPEPDGS